MRGFFHGFEYCPMPPIISPGGFKEEEEDEERREGVRRGQGGGIIRVSICPMPSGEKWGGYRMRGFFPRAKLETFSGNSW